MIIYEAKLADGQFEICPICPGCWSPQCGKTWSAVTFSLGRSKNYVAYPLLFFSLSKSLPNHEEGITQGEFRSSQTDVKFPMYTSVSIFYHKTKETPDRLGLNVILRRTKLKRKREKVFGCKSRGSWDMQCHLLALDLPRQIARKTIPKIITQVQIWTTLCACVQTWKQRANLQSRHFEIFTSSLHNVFPCWSLRNFAGRA